MSFSSGRLYVFSLFIRNELTNPDINEIWGLWTVIPAGLWIHNILQRIHREVKVTHKAGHVLCWPWPRLQTLCPGFTTDWPPCHSAWHGCCPQASSARCTWPPLLLALLLLCFPQGRMVERQGPTSPASLGQLSTATSSSAIYLLWSQRPCVLFIL